MSYNTDKYHQSYPPNNIANSYPPPPPGPPPPIAQTIYQPPPPPQGPPAYQHESLMQENHEHKKDREEDDEPEHWLTMILKMKFLRILTRFIDQGSPLMVYSLMKIWASNIIALVIAMVPPILRIIYFLIVYKHIDPCGVLYLAAFVIAACLTPIPSKYI
jgi:hypothetical protein